MATCFWWYKVASFCALSPGSRNSCRYLKETSGLEGRPASLSSSADSLAPACRRRRPRPPPPQGHVGKGASQGLCAQNSYTERAQLRPKAIVF